MKKWILVIAIIIAVQTCITAYKNREIHYTDNYPEIYGSQLSLIFGPDYKIGEKKLIKVEREDCGCGYHSDGYEYNEWDITYHDQNGNSFTQVLNNKDSLQVQQLSWLQYQLSQYYKQKYLIDSFEKGIFQDLSATEYYGKTYCFIQIGNPVISYTSDKKEEYDMISKSGNSYKTQLLEKLRNDSSMISLWNIDYTNIFNLFPVSVSFHLSMNDSELTGIEKETFEKNTQKKIIKMIDSFIEDTDGTCNLTVNMNSSNGSCDLYDGSRSWRYYILQGEWIEPENLFDYDYDWQFFYSYKGIYW